MTISAREASSAACVWSESMARGGFVAIAEDWAERVRHGAGQRLAPSEVLIDGEAFEGAMQPLRPDHIGVAIRDEGAVFDGDRLCHGCPDHSSSDNRSLADYPRGGARLQLTVQ
jgi:hypothetical protein